MRNTHRLHSPFTAPLDPRKDNLRVLAQMAGVDTTGCEVQIGLHFASAVLAAAKCCVHSEADGTVQWGSVGAARAYLRKKIRKQLMRRSKNAETGLACAQQAHQTDAL